MGNANKTNIVVSIKLQKRAIRLFAIANKLFIQSNTLKFTDIVYIKILEIMYRALNKSLPSSIQKLYKLREGRYI